MNGEEPSQELDKQDPPPSFFWLKSYVPN